MIHKTRPATAATVDRSVGIKRQINGSFNTSNATRPQAPPLPDIHGEDDWTYFRVRPGAVTRLRLPFENEYPVCVLLPGRPAVVRVLIERDVVNGQLKRRRSLRFCQGRTA
jgi:hypothetical protein